MHHTLIIGAGITGAMLARACTLRGHRVTVVSAHPAGGLASAASFGWINASFSLSRAHFDLRLAAMQAHRALSAALPGLHHWPGCLWYEEEGPAQDRAAEDLLALGYRVARLDRAGIARRLPALGLLPETALEFADEGIADPADLARAALAASGAALRGASVAALLTEGGRVTGVRLAEGEVISADRVVLAGGTGSPALLAPLGLHLPMLPRPGMIVKTAPLPPVCPVILATPAQEVRQDAAGRLIAPASASHQGDTAEVLGSYPALVSATLARLRALFPGVEIAFGSHAMANRPVPGDGLPVAGPCRQVPGLWLAVMHSGATLAPLVADLLAAEMDGGAESGLLTPFRPARYDL